MTQHKRKILSLPIGAAFCVLSIGMLFKIQHYANASTVLHFSFLAIGLLYSIRYFSKENKSLKDTSKFLMVVIWVLLSILILNKFRDLLALQIALIIPTLGWLFLEAIDKIQSVSGKRVESNPTNAFLFIGMALLIFNVIGQYQHWPFTSVVGLLGFPFITTGFFVDYSRGKRKAKIPLT